jgi:hypothetical protein
MSAPAWRLTKRIKAALQKIEQHHATLGLHLTASIKTGYQCAYLPDPHDPISGVRLSQLAPSSFPKI